MVACVESNWCLQHRISNFCTWASELFNTHFGAKIGLCENFTPLNFQPFVFSELWRLVHCQCTSIPSVGNKIIYTMLYSLNSVGNHNKIFYYIYIYAHLYDKMWYQTLKHMSSPTIWNCSPRQFCTPYSCTIYRVWAIAWDDWVLTSSLASLSNSLPLVSSWISGGIFALT
jgi:hypothetical protein